MGSGKSTVGRRLARALGRDFIDTDARVEASTGRSIRDIFAEDGENGFRDRESEALESALHTKVSSVIATGGGVVLRDTNRRLLDDHSVIWLRARPELLVDRVAGATRRGAGHRPLLDGDPLAKLTLMATERRAMYAEISDVIIDVDALAIEQIVRTCVDAVKELER
ncbi:MAG: shikimate kinase [Ilumatobacteraceae bacterium]|nr:shikimate kinase [Ilumatobacteraceae bacterium]